MSDWGWKEDSLVLLVGVLSMSVKEVRKVFTGALKLSVETEEEVQLDEACFLPWQ